MIQLNWNDQVKWSLKSQLETVTYGDESGGNCSYSRQGQSSRKGPASTDAVHRQYGH